MYLKQLEIFGFKSFPTKTMLKFDPGITVIVGPNGCGKSNILDAIRWALGEQSPKSLRGSRMEDVIFNGTETKPPLNYTEVILTFSNEDRRLPLDYKEVAIIRRLYRGEEGEYFINKSPVRLKDIQHLFLGTGIGETTYSFIEQGKIETLLSYKPEEKRMIFDEASGIVKYKERKKETLKKLEETDKNLSRLEDIISEVSRQIKYLERQVEKAKKYQALREKLIEVEKKIAVIKYGEIEKKLNSALEDITMMKEEEENKEKEIHQINEKLKELTQLITEKKDQLDKVNMEIVSLNSKIESFHQHIDINTQRIEELNMRMKTLEEEEVKVEKRISLLEERIKEEEAFLSSLGSNVEKLKKEVGELRIERDKLIGEINVAKKIIQQEKSNILDYEAKRVERNNLLIEIQTYLKSLEAKRKRLLADRARVESFCNQKKDRFVEMDKELNILKKELLVLKEEKEDCCKRLKEEEKKINDLQNILVEREKEMVEVNSYFDFLKELKIKYDNFPVSKEVTLLFEEEPFKINKLIISLKGKEFVEGFDNGKKVYRVNTEAKVISLQEEELKEKLDNLKEKIEEIKIARGEANQKKQELEELISQKEKSLLEVEKRLNEKMQEKDSLDYDLLRFKEEFELVESELSNTNKEIEKKEKEKERVEEEISNWEEKLREVEKRLGDSQNKVSLYSERIKAKDIEIARKESEMNSYIGNKDSLFSKVSLLTEEKNEVLKRREEMEREKEEISKKRVFLQEEIENLNKKEVENKNFIEKLIQDKERLVKEEENLEEEKKQVLSHQKEKEEKLAAIRNSLYSKKLEVQRLDFQKTKIIDYLKQTYNVEFSCQELKEIKEPVDFFYKEKERLKKEIASVGEANLSSIEEFNEFNERYQFLEKQRQDLLLSKEELKKAVQKINRTSRQIFLETFEKIEKEFKNYFKFLFGGGRGQFILLDKENVLETGVEIEVQPPGKKLQNVSLLSGGEKALTAVALIFAILKVKPSPVCILDEIDAPLDEANVDRFNTLLREFAKHSQFVVITHNKKTMSEADVLYGVTMEEKGISKIVSVKFAEDKSTSLAATYKH